jgi:psiF repeat
MKRLSISALICLVACAAYAQDKPTTPRNPSCASEATDKKLAGAAKNSFMKKCETDATAACDAAATDKKLSGAAKTSFTKKCVTDSVGS